MSMYQTIEYWDYSLLFGSQHLLLITIDFLYRILQIIDVVKKCKTLVTSSQTTLEVIWRPDAWLMEKINLVTDPFMRHCVAITTWTLRHTYVGVGVGMGCMAKHSRLGRITPALDLKDPWGQILWNWPCKVCSWSWNLVLKLDLGLGLKDMPMMPWHWQLLWHCINYKIWGLDASWPWPGIRILALTTSLWVSCITL
jgi:hypothetical protein